MFLDIISDQLKTVATRKPQTALPQPSTRSLRRAYGLGYGTGELLIKIPRHFDTGLVAEVVDFFLPPSLESLDITRPHEFRDVASDKVADLDFEYHILEVTSTVISLPMAQYITPRPYFKWLEFNAHNFPIAVNDEQREAILAFTGVTMKSKVHLARPHDAPKLPLPLATDTKSSKNGWYSHRVLDDVDVLKLKKQVVRHTPKAPGPFIGII